eukprot:4158028-Ditylum_brightwellii.AAC.1
MKVSGHILKTPPAHVHLLNGYSGLNLNPKSFWLTMMLLIWFMCLRAGTPKEEQIKTFRGVHHQAQTTINMFQMVDGECGRNFMALAGLRKCLVKGHEIHFSQTHLLMEDLHCTKMCTCHPNLENHIDSGKQLVACSVGLDPSTTAKVSFPD